MVDRRQALLRLGAAAALAPAPPLVQAETAGPSQIPPLAPATATSPVSPGWRHQTLPKVARANEFTVLADESVPVLEVRSAASASSWVAPVDIDPVARPWLHWRWKVSRALGGSDLRTRQRDDHAARLYVFFALDESRLPLSDRLRLRAARLLSGGEVPAAALCYVWGQAQSAGTHAPSPYTDRVHMWVVDSGDTRAGQWRRHARDVRQDWQAAFGGEVPPISGVALAADTDNTGEQVVAWFADLHFAASA